MTGQSVQRNSKRRLSIIARNRNFRRFLSTLLQGWGYEVSPLPAQAELVIAERGTTLTQGCPQVLWVSPLPAQAELVIAERGTTLTQGCPQVLWVNREGAGNNGELVLPLSVERLWGALEGHLHAHPRQHIRLPLNLRVQVQSRHGQVEVMLKSLSDMGGRILYPRELIRGDGLRVNFELENRDWSLLGRVIYVLPCGELEGSDEVEAGLLFEGLEEEDRRVLRGYILKVYLHRALESLGEQALAEGAAHFLFDGT